MISSLKEFLEETDQLRESSKVTDIDNIEVSVDIYDPYEIVLKDKKTGDVVSFPASTLSKIKRFIGKQRIKF